MLLVGSKVIDEIDVFLLIGFGRKLHYIGEVSLEETLRNGVSTEVKCIGGFRNERLWIWFVPKPYYCCKTNNHYLLSW